MAIVIQKIKIKAFHNFLLFLSMVLLLRKLMKKLNVELSLREQHTQESKVGLSW